MTGSFDSLERDGKIERVTTSAADVVRLLTVVDRDLETAVTLRHTSRDWALAIAYNAMLQTCHALMAAYGYRAKGEHQHRTMIEFTAAALPDADSPLDRLHRIRRRRHRVVYDAAGQTTETEVSEALVLAEELIPLLKRHGLEKATEGLT